MSTVLVTLVGCTSSTAPSLPIGISPCLEKYGLEQAVKKLVKRCCGHDDVPTDLRAKVLGRLDLIRSGQAVPEHDITATPQES